MHHLLLSVNNFFQSFFRKALRHLVPPCPVGLSQTRCASARSWLCLNHAPLSNTFFKFFGKSLNSSCIILILHSNIIQISHSVRKTLPLKQKIRLVFTGRTFICLNKGSSDEEKWGRSLSEEGSFPRNAYFFRKAANGEISRRL